MATKTITYRRDGFKAVPDFVCATEKLSVRGGGRLDSPLDISWAVADREIGRSQRICSAFSKSSRVHGRSILL